MRNYVIIGLEDCINMLLCISTVLSASWLGIAATQLKQVILAELFDMLLTTITILYTCV
jgi:hypothetical protein